MGVGGVVVETGVGGWGLTRIIWWWKKLSPWERRASPYGEKELTLVVRRKEAQTLTLAEQKDKEHHASCDVVIGFHNHSSLYFHGQ